MLVVVVETVVVVSVEVVVVVNEVVVVVNDVVVVSVVTVVSVFVVVVIDVVVVNEVVSHISIEREAKEVNVYHHYKNKIIRTYNEVKRYVFVVCESGAVYEPNEIFA